LSAGEKGFDIGSAYPSISSGHRFGQVTHVVEATVLFHGLTPLFDKKGFRVHNIVSVGPAPQAERRNHENLNRNNSQCPDRTGLGCLDNAR
jgi:hypothetical protein